MSFAERVWAKIATDRSDNKRDDGHADGVVMLPIMVGGGRYMYAWLIACYHTQRHMCTRACASSAFQGHPHGSTNSGSLVRLRIYPRSTVRIRIRVRAKSCTCRYAYADCAAHMYVHTSRHTYRLVGKCIRVHSYIYVNASTCMHESIHIWAQSYIILCTDACVYTNKCVRAHVCTFVKNILVPFVGST